MQTSAPSLVIEKGTDRFRQEPSPHLSRGQSCSRRSRQGEAEQGTDLFSRRLEGSEGDSLVLRGPVSGMSRVGDSLFGRGGRGNSMAGSEGDSVVLGGPVTERDEPKRGQIVSYLGPSPRLQLIRVRDSLFEAHPMAGSEGASEGDRLVLGSLVCGMSRAGDRPFLAAARAAEEGTVFFRRLLHSKGTLAGKGAEGGSGSGHRRGQSCS